MDSGDGLPVGWDEYNYLTQMALATEVGPGGAGCDFLSGWSVGQPRWAQTTLTQITIAIAV